MIQTHRNQVLADGQPIFRTRYPISKLLVTEHLYILLEESPLGIIHNRNVTAISPAGELRWKAEVLSGASGSVDNPYMSLWEKDGELWAGSWIGWAVQLDYADGRILQKVRI